MFTMAAYNFAGAAMGVQARPARRISLWDPRHSRWCVPPLYVPGGIEDWVLMSRVNFQGAHAASPGR